MQCIAIQHTLNIFFFIIEYFYQSIFKSCGGNKVVKFLKFQQEVNSCRQILHLNKMISKNLMYTTWILRKKKELFKDLNFSQFIFP